MTGDNAEKSEDNARPPVKDTDFCLDNVRQTASSN
jgi:hypothetical protein